MPMILKAIQMKELKNYYGNSLNYDYINFSDYFRTLSAEGRRQTFVTDKKFAVIKDEIGVILSDLIAEYTGYESTSVMKDTANDIFVSLLYCLDMALFTFASHEDALEYIIENKTTVRAAAKQFGVSKSTVHMDVSERLKKLNPSLYNEVREILDINKAERHIRGGLATKQKFSNNI